MTSPNGPDFSHEQALQRACGGLVCGIDEAGRGPWAGPVVAAAVILDPSDYPAGLNDSKTLAAAQRERLHDALARCAQIGVGIADVARIDEQNILQATLWAMAQAAAQLDPPPAGALVDGNKVPQLACQVRTLVKGDARSLCVAAASIVAKVTRDRIMQQLACDHPGYGWERNMGYGTKEHARALAQLGTTVHHRRSFRPIRELMAQAQTRQTDNHT